jgi:hypothetical protein
VLTRELTLDRSRGRTSRGGKIVSSGFQGCGSTRAPGTRTAAPQAVDGVDTFGVRSIRPFFRRRLLPDSLGDRRQRWTQRGRARIPGPTSSRARRPAALLRVRSCPCRKPSAATTGWPRPPRRRERRAQRAGGQP